MEWVIGAGFILVLFVVLGVIAERSKQRFREQQSEVYSSRIDAVKQSFLTGSDTASLPVLSAGDFGYRPVGKENLLAIQDGAVRMEMKSTGSYRTGGTSVSIPIVKGVRYRVGSGRVYSEKSWRATARGRLLVTDKAVIFEGDEKNERITWSQVANVEVLLDGFTISKRSGPPRTYQVFNPDPKFSAMLELMLLRTA